MNFQIITDIHLEHGRSDPFDTYLRPAADTLVIAGDLYPIKYLDRPSGFDKFMKYLIENWKNVIWVPGNHDYKGMLYGREMEHINDKVGNVHIVHNDTVNFDGVNFVCSTLWSYIPPPYEFAVRMYLSDFKEIGNFNPLHYNRLNGNCMAYIRGAVEDLCDRGENVVVVTHHLPTWTVVSDRYKNMKETYGFANNDLNDVLEDFDIKAWIHGHSHDFMEKDICGTTVIRNPVGYFSQRGKSGSDPEKVIEI